MILRKFYLFIFLNMAFNPAIAQEFEDVKVLQQQVYDYLNETLQQEGLRYRELEVNHINPLLKLKKCDNPLTHKLLSNGYSGGHLTVQTQCDGTSAQWSFYSPASLKIMYEIVLARHNLTRGQILTAADIEISEYETPNMDIHYLTRLEEALGKSLRRPIRQGEPLRMPSLEEPIAVNRGETVLVTATSGGLSVTSSAEALSNGRIGDIIKAKNRKSQRIVEGRITDFGTIAVNH